MREIFAFGLAIVAENVEGAHLDLSIVMNKGVSIRHYRLILTTTTGRQYVAGIYNGDTGGKKKAIEDLGKCADEVRAQPYISLA